MLDQNRMHRRTVGTILRCSVEWSCDVGKETRGALILAAGSQSAAALTDLQAPDGIQSAGGVLPAAS